MEDKFKKSFIPSPMINKETLYTYFPTPPLGQDMTKGQFLSGI